MLATQSCRYEVEVTDVAARNAHTEFLVCNNVKMFPLTLVQPSSVCNRVNHRLRQDMKLLIDSTGRGSKTPVDLIPACVMFSRRRTFTRCARDAMVLTRQDGYTRIMRSRRCGPQTFHGRGRAQSVIPVKHNDSSLRARKCPARNAVARGTRFVAPRRTCRVFQA